MGSSASYGSEPEAHGRTDPGWIVVEAAVAGRAEMIVTGDRELLDDPDLRAWLIERGIDLVTPAALARRLARDQPTAP
jgi:predicted nucleic acid-binding protein